MFHADKDEAAVQAPSLEREFEVAVFQRVLRCLLSLRFPVPAVPQHDGTAAVLAFGDCPLEIAIVQGMVLDFDCQTLVVRVERRPARDRPGFENAVEFQSKVVMQSRGIVLLGQDRLYVPLTRPPAVRRSPARHVRQGRRFHHR